MRTLTPNYSIGNDQHNPTTARRIVGVDPCRHGLVWPAPSSSFSFKQRQRLLLNLARTSGLGLWTVQENAERKQNLEADDTTSLKFS
jgi:hypothetical protein